MLWVDVGVQDVGGVFVIDVVVGVDVVDVVCVVQVDFLQLVGFVGGGDGVVFQWCVGVGGFVWQFVGQGVIVEQLVMC